MVGRRGQLERLIAGPRQLVDRVQRLLEPGHRPQRELAAEVVPEAVQLEDRPLELACLREHIVAGRRLHVLRYAHAHRVQRLGHAADLPVVLAQRLALLAGVAPAVELQLDAGELGVQFGTAPVGERDVVHGPVTIRYCGRVANSAVGEKPNASALPGVSSASARIPAVTAATGCPAVSSRGKRRYSAS